MERPARKSSWCGDVGPSPETTITSAGERQAIPASTRWSDSSFGIPTVVGLAPCGMPSRGGRAANVMREVIRAGLYSPCTTAVSPRRVFTPEAASSSAIALSSLLTSNIRFNNCRAGYGRPVIRRLRLRPTIAIVAVGVVVLAAWLAFRDGGQGLAALGGGTPLPADYYRLVDPDTIIVTGVTGEGQWTRVTNVSESPSEVRITVRSLQGPGTQIGIGYPIEWTVDLGAPLGDRVVNDGFNDLPRRD